MLQLTKKKKSIGLKSSHQSSNLLQILERWNCQNHFIIDPIERKCLTFEFGCRYQHGLNKYILLPLNKMWSNKHFKMLQ